MASIKSREEVAVKGIIGWQRLERDARGYHRHRVALLTESVTHPERVLKVTDLPQAFYRWESSLKEFQRGRPAELDDDVKANAMRHMMRKEILDADLQPQYRTFSEIRDYMLQQARQRADVHVGDVCDSTKKPGTVTPRVSTNTNTPAATNVSALAPKDVSQMSSNLSKSETVERENDSYQYEHDQECDGDELFAVKGKGKGGFERTWFKCGMKRTQKLVDAGRKEKEKEARETGRQEKEDPREIGRILVTRGTILGTIPTGSAKRMVLRWICGRLLNKFHISVQSV